MQSKLLKYIGFACAARALVLGTDLVLASVRKGKARIIILAADASARTAKQIQDKSNFYKVPVLTTEHTMEELAQAAGKSAPVAAMAVTDAGFAAAIKGLLKENQ